MTTVEFLADLRRRDIRIWADGGNLRCRAARGVLTAEIRSELAARKDEILKLFDEGRSGPQASAAPPRRVTRRGDLPLSFIQERLWFLYQLQPENTAYNIVASVRFAEPLNVAAVERTMTEIVRRHEALRTTFVSHEGQPFSVIAPAGPVRVPVVDLRGLPEAERRRGLESHKDNEARLPFDLTAGPLMRLTVLQSGDRDWELLIAQHHIISDRWSLGVLMNEVQTLYAEFSRGAASSLPEPQIQYVDFAQWQRDRMQGELLETQLAYWRDQLAGELPVLELPTDRPRPPIQTFNGTWESRALPPALGEDVRALCRRFHVTPFMLFVAAFGAVLQRWTGQDDILIGSPITGRSHPMLERTIGCFVNSLVLRADLAGDPSFAELLSRVREVALGAYSHAEVPFEKLVADLQPRRDLSRTALFQVSLALQSAAKSAVVSEAVTTTTTAGALFELTFFIVETADSFVVTAEYNTDLYDRSTIARLLGSFEQMLGSAVAEPDQPLSALSLLPAAERRRVVEEWNDTRRPQPDRCLHELVEAQVEKTPDAVALVCGEARMTYRELNARANQLARLLRSRGIGPEVLVGICMDRGLEMVVSMLAILKAGGAYVPIDPDYPSERLAFMFEDSRVALLLTQEDVEAKIGPTAMPSVCVDNTWRICAHEPDDNLPRAAGVDSLAYVIYTSGSTGRPKGAMNAHRGIVNRILWKQGAYALTAADRMLHKAPFSFDVSVWEVFWPLMAGAVVVVAPPGAHKHAEELIEVINRHRVTTTHFVPSMLQIFLESPNVESCGTLSRVFCGGEPLPLPALHACLERLNTVLYNEYGPTETAVDVTYWKCEPGERRTVPIGRPGANVRLYVLDDRMQPVPVGVYGELYIGGPQVGRGYLNRPELTAERFVPDPFSDAPGARLYRTGDRVRYLDDGNVEYLGRGDNQVKIRGVRIELGELEAALVAHPAVKDALVVVYEADGDKRLVAYFVCEALGSLTATELRRFLRQSLPEFMLPSFFVKLDQIPLMPNGKIDRRALPRPFDSAVRPEREYVAPRTEAEQRVAGIWREVLGGVETVGVYDNFFDVGGHSLLALKVLAQIEKVWKLRLHPNLMFLENLEQLAARCERVANGGALVSDSPGLAAARGAVAL